MTTSVIPVLIILKQAWVIISMKPGVLVLLNVPQVTIQIILKRFAKDASLYAVVAPHMISVRNALKDLTS